MVAILGVACTFHRLIIGRHILATGSNESAAVRCGVAVRTVKLVTFSLAGVLVGLGALLLTMRLRAGNPTVGVMYELEAIAAVAIGGSRLAGGAITVAGTVAGVLLMTFVRNGLNLLDVPGYWHHLCVGLLLVAAILYDTHMSSRREKTP